MNIKRYSLLVIMTAIIMGFSFCLGLSYNLVKRMHKAQVIGDIQIKNMTDESYMNETSLMIAEAYEIKRVLSNSDEAQAVVYINKKNGEILNRDVKDRAYIK